MRVISKPSTANCSLRDYVCYLLSEPLSASCSRLGKVMTISHDSVNRFLGRENYNSGDLLNEVKGKINLVGGILSVDDTVIDKPSIAKFRSKEDGNNKSKRLIFLHKV